MPSAAEVGAAILHCTLDLKDGRLTPDPAVFLCFLARIAKRIGDLDHLHAGYDRSAVLQGINMVVGEGEINAVLGRNGMDKTTPLRSIMGLLPTKGHLFFESEDIGDLPSHIRAQKGIGYVPEGRGLFKTMSVQDNLATGLEIGRLKRGHGDNDESFLHELFPVLRERSSQLAGTMSGASNNRWRSVVL